MNSTASRVQAIVTEIAEPPGAAAGARQKSTSVVTRMNFSVPPEEVWQGLMFYEQIGKRPPLLLRLLLPIPIRTEGRKSEVGDEVKCEYVSGHLLKRVIHVAHGRDYVFEVIEQNLSLGAGVKLLGGGYTVRELPGGGTQVSLQTSYVSRNRPRWLCQRIEAAVCHSFHRYILKAMRSELHSY
jgi:hypothetical protein